MTTNPYAEAVEAAAVRLANVSNLPEWMRVPALGRHMRPVAETAVDAATPRLLAPIRALAEELVNHGRNAQQITDGHMLRDRLDAIESEATSEGGARCVTVTRRYRDGEWEGDDLPTPDEALRMGWSV